MELALMRGIQTLPGRQRAVLIFRDGRIRRLSCRLGQMPIDRAARAAARC